VLVFVRTGRWPSLGGKDRVVMAAALALWILVVVVWVARFFGAFGGPVPV
jgi:hypothetical protein